MATYSFYIYTSSVLSYNSGTNAFDFDAGYSPYADRYLVEVNDDDTILHAGYDANEIATVYDLGGNVVASGQIDIPIYGNIQNPTTGGSIYIDHIDVGGVHVGYVTSEPLTPGTSYPYTGSGFYQDYYSYYTSNSVTCFTAGTLIETATGFTPVERIMPGVSVRTLNGGLQPVLWSGSSLADPLSMARNAALRPVVIPAHAFRLGAPRRTLALSRDHRVMLADGLVSCLFGAERVFAPAHSLGCALRGQPGDTALGYWHILLPCHSILSANGLWVESFFPGPEAMARLSPPDRQVIRERLSVRIHGMKTALPCLKPYEAAAYSKLRWSRLPRSA